MTKKKFYTDLVAYEEVVVKINKLQVTDEEKKHLEELAEANLHHTILNTILNELTDEDKHKFLEHVTSGEHDKLWLHLKEKVEGIEETIKRSADSFIKELHKDIENSKKEE